MITSEVYEHYVEGGKIRNKSWEKGTYIAKSCYEGRLKNIHDVQPFQLLEHDWEIYQEPPKKNNLSDLFNALIKHPCDGANIKYNNELISRIEALEAKLDDINK